MNKLLLLATSLICLNIPGYTAEFPLNRHALATNTNTEQSKPDSTSPASTNPVRNDFKDLFEVDAATGVTARLNPRAVSFVQDYMEAEGTRLGKMRDWGKPFFDRISSIFTDANLPAELKYLAVIESDLKTSATSRVGAAGPWQLMPGTARGLGLKVNSKVDERHDFNKSTKAAARFLSNLYDEYNDWLLVIAAYNGGPGTVNKAMARSGSSNFWDLQQYLPAESRMHVKKFIATHYIMEGNAGLTTLTKKETQDLMNQQVGAGVDVAGTTTITVTGKYHSSAIIQVLGLDAVSFNQLNPNFDRLISANGSYLLRLPDEKMKDFQSNRNQILDQSIQARLNAR